MSEQITKLEGYKKDYIKSVTKQCDESIKKILKLKKKEKQVHCVDELYEGLSGDLDDFTYLLQQWIKESKDSM